MREQVSFSEKKGLYFIVDQAGRPLKTRPWLADSFSFMYDFIMQYSIFPRKFGGDIERHYEILSEVLQGIHEKRVLELATGSGSSVNFLHNDNRYTGSDISPGLLRRAASRFRHAGFNEAEFYVTGALDLPFDDKCFDVVLCILALNFFGDIDKAVQEVRRVCVPGAQFIGSVPVPERKRTKSTIRGRLLSEEGLKTICDRHGMRYESIPAENGALLYFKAIAG